MEREKWVRRVRRKAGKTHKICASYQNTSFVLKELFILFRVGLVEHHEFFPFLDDLFQYNDEGAFECSILAGREGRKEGRNGSNLQHRLLEIKKKHPRWTPSQ